jgi:hypothetical protein
LLTPGYAPAGTRCRARSWIDPLRFAHHLDPVKTLQHFLPDDLELQFGEPHADAAVNAEAERQMGTRAGAIDDELVGPFDPFFVAVARDVPHHDAIALPDLLPPSSVSTSAVRRMCASGVCQRITLHHVFDQVRLRSSFWYSIGVFLSASTEPLMVAGGSLPRRSTG